MKTEFSTSAVRRAETDRGSKARLSDRQLSNIAAVEVSEHESPLLDRALAWWQKQPDARLSDLQTTFKLHPSVQDGYSLSSADDVSEAIARHFAAKRFSARCKQLREDYELLRPSFAAHSKCSPVAFQIWESEYLAYATRKGIKDTTRMGYDEMGHWGANSAMIEKLWFACGCKDSPKLRFLFGYEMRRDPRDISSYHFIKKSHSLQECKDILRGANWLQRHDLYWGPYSFGSVQLRTLGRVSLPIRHALVRDLEVIVNEEGSKHRTCIRSKQGAKLNYEFAAEVQQWSREHQASTFLSPKVAHYYLGGNAEEWAEKQEAERIALASTELQNILAECRRIVEACAGIIPVPCNHPIRVGESVKVGCTWITVKHGRNAELNGETLGIALAILEAYESQVQMKAA